MDMYENYRVILTTAEKIDHDTNDAGDDEFKVVFEAYDKVIPEDQAMHEADSFPFLRAANRESSHPLGLFATAETARQVVEDIMLSDGRMSVVNDSDMLLWQDGDSGEVPLREVADVVARVSEFGARIAGEGGSAPAAGIRIVVETMVVVSIDWSSLISEWDGGINSDEGSSSANDDAWAEKFLETVKYDGGGSKLDCVICMEEVPAGEDMVEMPCRHRFHGHCIRTWLHMSKTTCPLCRFDFKDLARP